MQLNAPDATERSIPTNQDTLAKKCSTEAHTCDGVVWQSMQKRCEVGGWSVYFDKYILQFGQICFLFRQIQILSGTKIQVWLTRVTDRTVPWLPQCPPPPPANCPKDLYCVSHSFAFLIIFVFVFSLYLYCVSHSFAFVIIICCINIIYHQVQLIYYYSFLFAWESAQLKCFNGDPL